MTKNFAVVTVRLSAFARYSGRPVTEYTFDFPFAATDKATELVRITRRSPEFVAEEVFVATNTQVPGHPIWDIIAPLLPPERSHTSLSVGDVVIIDGTEARCEAAGWEITEPHTDEGRALQLAALARLREEVRS